MSVRNLCVQGADPDQVFPTDDVINWFHWQDDYGLLLVRAGVFPNVKAAWSLNYKGAIPVGWNDFTLFGTHIYIYNPREVQWADCPWGAPTSATEHFSDINADWRCSGS